MFDPPSPWRPIRTKKFMIGVAHYPEHEPRKQIEIDADLMAEAGINIVRMGEFAWSLFEPEEGRFTFDLFDEVIEKLGQREIATILCTPTATPPRWLTAKHPDIIRVDSTGRTMQHGSRQHADLTHPVFREYSRRITSALADHYANNNYVVGWQTDNEFNTHFSETHSAAAQAAFRTWLQNRYGDVATLNISWGTVFWNRQYDSFDQIETPVANAPAAADPSHMIDYHRFLAQSTADFQRDQVTILRQANSGWFVFHNIGYLRDTDLRGDFGHDIDFIGQDVYPFLMDEVVRLGSAYCQALQLDQIRGWAGNFIVPEQQTGFGGQSHFATSAPEPGEMRRMAMSSIARGADGLIFFRWRTARFGAESYWMGLLDHDGVPRRRLSELQMISSELEASASNILGSSVQFDVGIAACDHDNILAHASYNMGLPAPLEASVPLHAMCYLQNIACGFLAPDDDLSRIKLLFIPHLVIWDNEWTAKLQHFVENGGIAVIGCRSATRDRNNHVQTTTPPGLLADLCGVQVQEFGRIPAPSATGLISGRALGGDHVIAPGRPAESAKRKQRIHIGGAMIEAAHWYEILDAQKGTEILARWVDRSIADKPAIVAKDIGKGRVIYVGTYITPALVGALFAPLIQELGITALINAPPGVEATIRSQGENKILFIQNTTDQPQTAKLHDRKLELPPYDCITIQL